MSYESFSHRDEQQERCDESPDTSDLLSRTFIFVFDSRYCVFLISRNACLQDNSLLFFFYFLKQPCPARTQKQMLIAKSSQCAR